MQDRNYKIMVTALWVGFGILFLPFWKSISLAGIFALALHPYLARHRKNKALSGKLVVGAVSLTTLLIITPFLLGAYELSSQVVEISKSTDPQALAGGNLQQTINTHVAKVNNYLVELGIPKTKATSEILQKVGSAAGAFILSTSGTVLGSVPDLVLNLLMFTLALYAFLAYGSEIKSTLISWHTLKKKDLEELVDVLHRGSFQCISSLLIVGSIQASFVLIGAVVAGFDMLLGIFVLTFVLSFIPVVGAAPVAFVMAIMKVLEGSWGLAIFLAVLGAFVGIVDNIIKPLLIKRGIDIDASLALISIIGAIVVFGLPGLFLGPVIGTTATYYFHKNRST